MDLSFIVIAIISLLEAVAGSILCDVLRSMEVDNGKLRERITELELYEQQQRVRTAAAIDRVIEATGPHYHYREGAEETPVAKTVEVGNSINVDLDANGDVVGVEIL